MIMLRTAFSLYLITCCPFFIRLHSPTAPLPTTAHALVYRSCFEDWELDTADSCTFGHICTKVVHEFKRSWIFAPVCGQRL
ncbi:hypothetical protein EDB19DRAFT_1752266 [Suillus lakei]|nr:hypothetical protein EDB19DRAFT_1752266 [Suillus lakei]